MNTHKSLVGDERLQSGNVVQFNQAMVLSHRWVSIANRPVNAPQDLPPALPTCQSLPSPTSDPRQFTSLKMIQIIPTCALSNLSHCIPHTFHSSNHTMQHMQQCCSLMLSQATMQYKSSRDITPVPCCDPCKMSYLYPFFITAIVQSK